MEALDVSCLEPGATLNTMAAFDGSCFPLFDVVEYETAAGTLESEWHFRQRSEVSSGLAGSGQMRSGTAAWNETPLAVVIRACVWQPVQSILGGSLTKAVWQLAHWNWPWVCTAVAPIAWMLPAATGKKA
jgi:hypothetical protein